MIAAIIERLEATGAFAGVELSEDLDASTAGTMPRSGRIFVMPNRESGAENSLATGFRQRVEVEIVTAFILRQHDDPRGAGRARAFDRYKAAVEQALAGWQPPGAEQPLELVGGEGTPLGNNVSIYVQSWTTSRYLTGEV